MKKPCISKNIEVIPRSDGRMLAFNKMTKKSFSLGKKEYLVFSSLDGTSSVEDIQSKFDFYSRSEISLLLKEFYKLGLIEDNTGLSPSQMYDKELHQGPKPSLRSLAVKILFYKKGLFSPDKFIKPEHPLFKALNFTILYLSLPVFILGIYATVAFGGIKQPIATPPLYIFLFVFLLSVVLHELAHMTIAKKYGATITEFGICLNLLIPCAYSSIVGIPYIDSKFKRILIASAGILMNLQLAGLGLLFYQISTGLLLSFFLSLTIFNMVLIAFNLIFLLKFDGYFILAELLNDKKLKENAHLYLRYIIFAKLLRARHTQEISMDISTKRKIAYIAYASINLIFMAFIVTVSFRKLI